MNTNNSVQWANNLADYDASTYGPLLGVSDEGSAAKLIAAVAQSTPKMMVLNSSDVNKVGVIIDGERMTSAGECPIGHEEYHSVVNKARHQTNCTTNVGTRIHTRYYQQHPELPIAQFLEDRPGFEKAITQLFAPFVATKRPLKVRILISDSTTLPQLETLNQAIAQWRQEGKLGPASLHRIALLLTFNEVISASQHQSLLEKWIDIVAQLQFTELALDGHPTDYSRKRLSTAGLLNILEIPLLEELLARAQQRNIQLRYRYCLDLESASRTIWTALTAARSFGLNGAKYGLTPLMLEEQLEVIGDIQQWAGNWTAIPAFYVDTPLYSKTSLFRDTSIATALKEWLQQVQPLGVTTVLVDAPDRIAKRRLIKRSATDAEGVLTLEAIKELFDYSKTLGIQVLWSGGITYAQAFELGKLQVFGIFTTSTTAKRVAVGIPLQEDPQLSHEVEPTEKGIKAVLNLLHGGYLLGSSKVTPELKNALQQQSETLITQLNEGLDKLSFDQLETYCELIRQGWQQQFK